MFNYLDEDVEYNYNSKLLIYLDDLIAHGFYEMSTSELAYHNLNHVEAMLATLKEQSKINDTFAEVYNNPDTRIRIILAIAWHDAIFVVGAKNNEEESVKFLRSIVDEKYLLMFPELNKIIDDVDDLIMSTSRHFSDYAPKNNMEAVLMDLDLINFSWNTELFLEETENVRQESLTIKTPEDADKGLTFFFNMIKDFQYFVLDEKLQKQASENINFIIEKLNNSAVETAKPV